MADVLTYTETRIAESMSETAGAPASSYGAAAPPRRIRRHDMERFIEKTDQEQYEVIVIGGGITGAAVAYDAASRGLSVALLEKKDFGWATSAATSKLIHGGLRYLATFEYGLVRESLRERKRLKISPPILFTRFRS
jgi:hypothetical protein